MAVTAVNDFFTSINRRPVIYDVSLNDTGECLDAELFLVKAPPCFNDSMINRGALGLRVMGGVAPYTYLWTKDGLSVLNPTIKNRGFVNTKGTWQVVVTDSLGSSVTRSIVMTALSNTNLTLSSSQVNPSSSVSSDGSVSVSGVNGLAPYKYYWMDNNSTSDNRVGMQENLYQFMIIDSNGCMVAIAGIEIKAISTTFNVNALVYRDIRNGNHGSGALQYVNANIHKSPSAETYTYLWSNGSTTPQIYNVAPGTYSVTVTGSLGNNQTITGIVVTATPVILVNITTTNSSGGLANGSIIVNSLTNTIGSIFTYHLLNTTLNEYFTDPNALVAGIYTITVFTDYGEQISRSGVTIL